MGFQLEKVRYKNILAIDNLVLPDSKVICIVGESGSGKTTLLRLLNNLISADSGFISYNGTNLVEIDPVSLRRRVVMLSQNSCIFPGTIENNLLIGREFAGLTAVTADELQAALDQAKLSKPLTANAAELSGGEKQRLALARILLLRPEVLLLDEPSSALDEDTEKLVIESIIAFARHHELTLIMVTHSKVVANTYADLVITISHGQVAGIKEAVHP